MPITSAGILLYRITAEGVLEVWIAHMGGPFWARKDDGAWSIPKGEYLDEDELVAAKREFEEETGARAPDADYLRLGPFRQSSGKLVTVFAAESDVVPETIVSNTFEIEWPKGSGRFREFPEIDAARWFSSADAHVKLVKGQRPMLDALEAALTDAG
jgi:predicted NUDIX family NTP pyrophosphohydrolase